MSKQTVLSALARAFLAGPQTMEQLTRRAGEALGKRWRWLRPLARRYTETYGGKLRPREREIVQFLANQLEFRKAWSKYSSQISVVCWPTESQKMQPIFAARNWKIPAIESIGELAGWLGLTFGELEWFADLKGLAAKKNISQLGHYHYRILVKRSGNLRLIEAPKLRLRDLQQKILAEILDQVPPHPAVHGFRKGRSIKTFVAPHAGKRVVLRMDIQDFFPCFIGARGSGVLSHRRLS